MDALSATAMARSLSAAFLLLAMSCTAGGAVTRASGPRAAPAPVLDVSSTALARAALAARFDELLRRPAQMDAALADSRRRFPEGDLLPLTLAAVAYGALARSGELGREAALARMSELIERAVGAVRTRVGEGDLATMDELHHQGTFIGQLAWALGHWRLAGGDDRFDAIHARLIALLVDAVAARGGEPIDSYPDERWPIDTVVALAAIAAYERHAGGERAAELMAAHARWTRSRGSDPACALPVSQVGERTSMPPRGSDLSWRIALLADLDRALAEEIYRRYVDCFWVEEPVGGFAEWQGGQERPPDVDSGPMFLGVGSTASAFGLAACAAMSDAARCARLERQLVLGRALVERSHGSRIATIAIDARYVTGFLLGDATLFYALTRRRF